MRELERLSVCVCVTENTFGSLVDKCVTSVLHCDGSHIVIARIYDQTIVSMCIADVQYYTIYASNGLMSLTQFRTEQRYVSL